jgi:subtilisin family serine protease
VEKDASRRAAASERQRSMVARLEQSGIAVRARYETVANAVSVEADETTARALAATPGVKRVIQVCRRQPLLDRAASLHKAIEAWQIAGGRDNAGRGIKVGIIDTGIDADHPAMNDASLTVPEGYPKFRREADRAMTNNKIIAARSYDDLDGIFAETSARDRDGHGTGVAMSAAGAPVRANFAEISGFAPKAFLGAYRVFPYSGEGASDDIVLRAIEDAINDGMDVINLSLGSEFSTGEVDGLYEAAFARALAAGTVIVAAAGNSGSDPVTVASPAYLPSTLAVAATWNSRTFRFPVEAGTVRTLGVLSDNAGTPNTIDAPLADVAALDQNGLACGPLPEGSLSGRIAFILRGSCTFEDKVNNVMRAGAAAALIYTHTLSPTAASFTVQSATLPTMMIDNTAGVAIKQDLSVGALNARLFFNGEPNELNSRQISSFSARGPSPLRTLKPELSAVGSFVYTAAGRADSSSESYNASGYLVTAGTSFSSPIVAGAVAAIRAQRPGLTAAQYRSLAANTASAIADADDAPFRPVEVGAGTLNLENAFRSPLALSEVTLTFGGSTGAIDRTATVKLFNLSKEPESFRVEVLPRDGGAAPTTSAAVDTIPAGESADLTVTFAASGLPAGVYQGIVQVTSASTGIALRLPYWMAVSANDIRTMRVMAQSPTVARAGSPVDVYVRIVDSSGLTVVDGVTVNPVSAGLRVESAQSAEPEVPGCYRIRLIPAAFGVARFEVSIGEARREVSLNVR